MTSECRTPAQLIDMHLRERGWTQRVLSLVLGVNEQIVSRILNGAKPIDAELALTLEAVLGIDPKQLLQLQKEYELAKAQIELRLDPALATRAALFNSLPIAEIVKRGWLRGITDVRDPDLESSVQRFFGKDSISDIEALPHAAKKTDMLAEATPAELAWLYRIRQLADDALVAKYSEASLRSAVDKLRGLLVSPDAARKVSRILGECGVRFVIVQSLPTTKIDGVCLWLDDKSPVIGMTLRFDRIDNFWFVLRHEIEHVLQGHGKVTPLLDSNMETQTASISEEEAIANDAAANFCVPSVSLNKFIAKKAPYFAERDILGFAKTLGVHPGLVAGQLQRKTGRYDLFRDHLVKIRLIVTPGTIIDGWGDVAPVGA